MLWSHKAFGIYMGQLGDVMATDAETGRTRDMTFDNDVMFESLARADASSQQAKTRRGWLSRARAAVGARAQVARSARG